jgi:short-subunit dehydrogenase
LELNSNSNAALITGASSGIGRAIALELSKKGLPIILVARNRSKLEEVAKEIFTPVLIIEQDLSKPGAAAEIFKKTSEKNIFIEIVVNNAGFGIHGEFIETDISKEVEMVELQITATLELTKFYLREMCKRKKGRFLNVSSVYSYSSVPQQAVYGACKAFMRAFSYSLAEEVKRDGVTITVVYPGVTQSEFRMRAGIHEKKAAAVGMSPETVAKKAVAAMLAGKSKCIPAFRNKLFIFAAKLIPGPMMVSVMGLINRIRGVNT